VIVAVPVLLITVVALINRIAIARLAISITIKVTSLRYIFIRLALTAVKESFLTAPLIYDIFNAGFAATHTKVLLEGHSD
jgi:hypothetical protein